MRTFASLLKGGYVPKHDSPLWRMNEENLYLQFCRFNHGARNKTPIVKPYNRKFTPELLYIHPYFPDKPLVAVQIIKPFPFGKIKMVHYLEKGILSLTKNIRFSEKDIYLYPTFFKPLYNGHI